MFFLKILFTIWSSEIYFKKENNLFRYQNIGFFVSICNYRPDYYKHVEKYV